MLFIKDLKKYFGIYEILKAVNVSMKKGECLALTGPNGCGKTTLLKCIIGEIEQDSGEIFLDRDIRFGYLKQKDIFYDGKVKYFLLKEFEDLQQTLIKMDDNTISALDYSLLMDDFIMQNGFEKETLLLKELNQFGFNEQVIDECFNKLSPGQKKIMEMISILISQPDLFIMDEPTNHMDISMRVFLENFINRKKREGISFLIVSHDRTFLDRICDQTVYIKRGISHQIAGGYSDMLEFLEDNFRSKRKESEQIQQKISRLENFVRRKTDWSSKAEGQKVANVFRKYGFLALPVVDKEHRLTGIITVDDIMNVMKKEATEDFQRMAAMTPSEGIYLSANVFTLTKHRIAWLLILMISAMITGSIISKYENVLESVVILATFIPMLMDTGGNAGSQSSTLIIRGLATGELLLKDVWKILWKEFKISLIVGVSLAAVNFARIMIFSDAGTLIAFTVSVTLIVTIVSSKLLGGMLPLLAKKMKIDPAMIAGPLITTIVDGLSLVVYFGIASNVLNI